MSNPVSCNLICPEKYCSSLKLPFISHLLLFSFLSEQSGFGKAREGQRSGKLSHSNGPLWKVRRKGKTKQQQHFSTVTCGYVFPNGNTAVRRFSFSSDFRVRLDRDPRKSQSTNREEDNCQSKFRCNERHICLTNFRQSYIYLSSTSSTDGG